MRTVAVDGDYGCPATPDWRPTDWAAHQRDALIAGARLHYIDVGAGELAVVLVHGMGGRWQHWLETIPSLAQRARVIALDLPGFGRSEAPRTRYSLDAFADAAAELCSSLGVERAVFVGHSLGGPVALRFASRHPSLARAIVLVAGAVYTFSAVLGSRDLLAQIRRRPLTTAATFFEVTTAALPAPRPLRRAIVTRPSLRRALLWPYLRDAAAMPADSVDLLIGGGRCPGVLPTALAVGRANPRGALDHVRCPILSIGASDDRVAPLADLEVFAREAPTATSVLLEGSGHMMMLERAQAFNDELRHFLDGLE